VKLRAGVARSSAADVNGGATLGFDVHEEHPCYEETLGLLKRVRTDVNELWQRVEKHNETAPVPEDKKVEVAFYFGQSVTRADASDTDPS